MICSLPENPFANSRAAFSVRAQCEHEDRDSSLIPSTISVNGLWALGIAISGKERITREQMSLNSGPKIWRELFLFV